jgi:hypothetical protein
LIIVSKPFLGINRATLSARTTFPVELRPRSGLKGELPKAAAVCDNMIRTMQDSPRDWSQDGMKNAELAISRVVTWNVGSTQRYYVRFAGTLLPIERQSTRRQRKKEMRKIIIISMNELSELEECRHQEPSGSGQIELVNSAAPTESPIDSNSLYRFEGRLFTCSGRQNINLVSLPH